MPRVFSGPRLARSVGRPHLLRRTAQVEPEADDDDLDTDDDETETDDLECQACCEEPARYVVTLSDLQASIDLAKSISLCETCFESYTKNDSIKTSRRIKSGAGLLKPATWRALNDRTLGRPVIGIMGPCTGASLASSIAKLRKGANEMSEEIDLANWPGRNNVERAMSYLSSTPKYEHATREIVFPAAVKLVRDARANPAAAKSLSAPRPTREKIDLSGFDGAMPIDKAMNFVRSKPGGDKLSLERVFVAAAELIGVE